MSEFEGPKIARILAGQKQQADQPTPGAVPETPTPRTDALLAKLGAPDCRGDYEAVTMLKTLERELAAARQSIERLTLDLRNTRTNFRAAIDACTELRDENERLRRTLIQLRCDECDERALAQKGERESLPLRKPLDVEKMLAACIPGGQSCDPQQVADSIRAYIEGGEG